MVTMNIVSSYKESPPHQDGRTPVVETHELEDGRVFKYEYLRASGINAEYVLNERRSHIEKELQDRATARALVTGSEVPYTKHEFLSRFTTSERIAIRNRAKTDDIVLDFMEMLNASGGVYMTLGRQGIGYLQAIGILTVERAAQIGAD